MRIYLTTVLTAFRQKTLFSAEELFRHERAADAEREQRHRRRLRQLTSNRGGRRPGRKHQQQRTRDHCSNSIHDILLRKGDRNPRTTTRRLRPARGRSVRQKILLSPEQLLHDESAADTEPEQGHGGWLRQVGDVRSRKRWTNRKTEHQARKGRDMDSIPQQFLH